MYNEALKTSFIRDYTSSLNTARVCQETFNAFEKLEWSEGKDLCELTTEQIQPIATSIFGIRTTSKWQRLLILRAYAKWCIAKNVPGASENIYQLETDSLEKVRQTMVSSPSHFQMYLDSVFEPDEDKTVDVVYRCYLWLAYAGMDERDILFVRPSDIHIEDMAIVYNNEEYPIYREGIKAIRYSATLDQFIYRNKNYKRAGDVLLDRAPGDSIFRGTRGSSSYETLINAIAKRSTTARREGRTSVSMSYYRAWISGVFYRMYERERAGIPVNFSDVVDRYYLRSKKARPNAKEDMSTLRTVNARMLADYKRWKAAFSI